MTDTRALQVGMEVYNVEGLLLGQIERVQGDEFLVQGAHFTLDAIAWVDGQRVHLRDLRETRLLPDETESPGREG